MKFKSILSFVVLILCSTVIFAQDGITIKKKTSMKIPGAPVAPPGVSDPLKPRSSTVYIKGARMRNDIQMQVPKMGGMKTVTFSTITQCDKQRSITFSSDKKKYFQESFSGSAAGTNGQNIQAAKKGGYVTIAGSVIDTGNRAKLFGYDAKHLKQTFSITPSKDACQKESMQIEIEGWYADLPEFSCPVKRKPQEFQMNGNCYDEVIDQVKGAVTGIALKEVKKITTSGMTMTVEEEVTSLTKTPLADSLFEPPVTYTAANTLREVQEDTSDSTTAQNDETIPAASSSTSFAPPVAGLDTAASGEKKPGMVRVGIAVLKVTTPESKNDPNAGDSIASAVQSSLIESLKAEKVEAVALGANSPENEAKEKGCDYIFYANVTHKRGGGMFGKMILMGALSTVGGFIPGVGGMIAGTAGSVIMGQTMGKMAKAKDEFTLDYKVAGTDNTILSQAVTKAKTKEDGEDVLTPQIKQAATTVLGEIAKKKTAPTP